MNGRKLFREYAQSKGKEAKEFIKIDEIPYEKDILTTKDNEGKIEVTTLDYKDVVFWLIKSKKLKDQE